MLPPRPYTRRYRVCLEQLALYVLTRGAISQSLYLLRLGSVIRSLCLYARGLLHHRLPQLGVYVPGLHLVQVAVLDALPTAIRVQSDSKLSDHYVRVRPQ
jgi:hypothetical protein